MSEEALRSPCRVESWSRHGAISRPQWIRPQPILHIGNDQLLMLLLVIDAQLNQLDRLGRKFQREQVDHRLVHIKR